MIDFFFVLSSILSHNGEVTNLLAILSPDDSDVDEESLSAVAALLLSLSSTDVECCSSLSFDVLDAVIDDVDIFVDSVLFSPVEDGPTPAEDEPVLIFSSC